MVFVETELEKKRLSPQDYIIEADTSQIVNKDVWPKHRQPCVWFVWNLGVLVAFNPQVWGGVWESYFDSPALAFSQPLCSEMRVL